MWDTLILDPMINALLVIYDLLGNNFGLAIIVFTVIIRLITLPLSLQQQKSSMKMQDLQKTKRWKDLEKKYKDNKKKLQEEQLKIYQEIGFNPMSGCLPTLIQFPIIIGLYQAIIRTLAVTPIQLLDLSGHIYQSGFFSIPSSLLPLTSNFLWMNLGQPERFWVTLPIVGLFGIPVLTILVVISTYYQSKLTMATTPGDGEGQGAQMTKMMSLYMPLMLGYFAYTFASGLALYFVASNLLGIAQYSLIKSSKGSNIDLASVKKSVKK